jgi:starch-binding outer membrane protein, SusD/RagB family
MKRIKNIYALPRVLKLTLIGFLFASMSCSDWLQLEPESDLTREEFWRSGADVEAAAGGIYKELAANVTPCLKWGELRGDIFLPGSRIDVDDLNVMESNIYPENSLTKWDGFYKTINYANTLLEFAPKVVERDQTFTENESRAYEAEALFLRSLCYFYLVRTFRDVPMVLDASLSDNQDYYPAMSKEPEILDQLVADLKNAVNYLPNTYGKLEYDKGRATKGAVYALLADIYLHNENYAECISNCDQVINGHQFALVEGEDWFFNFYPGNSNESIFEVQFDKDQNQVNSLYSMTAPYPADYSTYPDGNDEFRFSPYVVKLFTKYDGDRRGGGKTYLPYNVDNNHYILWKYIGTTSSEFIMTPRNGNQESDADWIVYRYADILLMKAEASIELGNYSTAVQLINQIRKRAGIELIPESSNKSALLSTLLDERAREFAGEGKRWFDLVRFGRRNNFENKDKFISILIANKPLDKREILRSKYSNTDSWYMPVNQNEIDQNSKLEQNPYYVNH